eukprot:SAG25_NODE_10633_length_327_cov_0.802632_1_plen_38_part_10
MHVVRAKLTQRAECAIGGTTFGEKGYIRLKRNRGTAAP